MNRLLFRLTRVLISVAVVAAATPALSQTIFIDNWSFESSAQSCTAGPNCFQLGVIPGWTVSSIPRTATFKPSIGTGGIFPAGVPDGVNVAGVGNQDGTASIMQTTVAALEANRTYTLSAAIGHRADFPFSGYSIQLYAGNTYLASSSALTPDAGTFLTDTLTFNSGTSPAGLGQLITIQLVALVPGGQVDFDTITLNSAAVPAPAAAIHLLTCLGVIGMWCRKHRRIS